LLLKIAVLAVSLWVLYDKLIVGHGFENFSTQGAQLFHLLYNPMLWAVVLLMTINWGIEALKWRMLINRFEVVSFKTAIKSVCTGVFISLFVNILVPNRMGEFAGRIIYVKINKIKAVLITTIGSYAQFAATVVFGAIAYLVFWNTFFAAEWENFTGYLLIAAVAFVAVLIPLLYFNINVVSWVLGKPKLLRRFKKITSVFYFYDNKRLLQVFALAVLRYAVFCGQFILLLQLCGVDISAAQGLMIVPVIFLVQTIVPSNALSDLGVRGAASIHFLNYYSSNNTGILAAAYSLWAINILLPGLAGAVFFSVFKYREGNGSNN
jgi:uncharacterized membrane protein YbhN (UPF0104 family)